MGLTQIKCYGGRSSETEVPSFNVANITQGLGVHGERVEKPEEMIPALERALGSGKLALLEEAVDASLENIVPLQVYECRIVATHDNWEIMVRARD